MRINLSENTTASNQGAGVGVVDEKVGADIEFRSLVSPDGTIGIALDDVNDEVDLTMPADIVTNARLADMAAWTIKARNDATTGDPQDIARGTLTEEATPTGGHFLVGWNTDGELRKFDVGDLPTGGGGESNTASNQGAGVGVFEAKSGIDLQFRSLVSPDSTIGVTLDAANKEIDLVIPDGVVTFAKIQDVTGPVLFGRSTATAGDASALSVTTARSVVNLDVEPQEDLGSQAGPMLTIDYSNVGTTDNQRDRKFTATGDVDIDLPAPGSTPSGIYQINCYQDGTGGRTITFADTISEAYRSAPVVNAGANELTVFRLYNDKTSWIWI